VAARGSRERYPSRGPTIAPGCGPPRQWWGTDSSRSGADGEVLAANSGDPGGGEKARVSSPDTPTVGFSKRTALNGHERVFRSSVPAHAYIYTQRRYIYVLSETDPRETTLVVGSTQSVISDSDDVTTDSSQIVQVATTTATPRHRSAFRVIAPSVYNRIHLREIKKKKKRNKAKTKVVLPSRSTKPSPPVISVSVLHLRSRNCGFNQSNWIPTSSTCREYFAATGGLRNYSR